MGHYIIPPNTDLLQENDAVKKKYSLNSCCVLGSRLGAGENK